MLEQVRRFDPTVTVENAAEKLGNARFETLWRHHVENIVVPKGRERGMYTAEAWNKKWDGHPELFLFSNDTLYAVLREADPEWKHEKCAPFTGANGKVTPRNGMCPWQ